MTLEELADLIRANSANTNRRIGETRNETYGQLLNIRSDLTDLRGDLAEVRTDVAEVRRTLDLADTVAAMKRQIEMLEAEVAALKRRA